MTTQEKIKIVATTEFLVNGYLGASLRKIAKAANVTTGAMYGYYKNKEALFNELVEEVAKQFKDEYLNHDIDQKMIDYIYQHFDVFRLLICSSEDTRYENYLDDLVDEKAKQFKQLGIDDKLIHIINHAYLFGVFEIVRHQMTKDQAEVFVNDLQEFYQAGWHKLVKEER